MQLGTLSNSFFIHDETLICTLSGARVVYMYVYVSQVYTIIIMNFYCMSGIFECDSLFITGFLHTQ